MEIVANPNFLVVDDHTIIRQGMVLLIKELFGEITIQQAGTFNGALEILNSAQIDVLVLDINFPEGNSLSIIPEVKTIQPDIKILIFSALDDNIYAMRYLNAGASGYLNKGSSEAEIKNALTQIVTTGKYVTQDIEDKIAASKLSKKPINPLEILSKREIEVAKLFVKGLGNLEVSGALQIKQSTVSTFKNRVFEKLEIDNLSALIEIFNLYFEEDL